MGGDLSFILKLHNISLHQLLYDVLLTELTVKIPRFLWSLHHYANMHFNTTPIQSFLMSSGTGPFASITEWVQSEGQTVQHQYDKMWFTLEAKYWVNGSSWNAVIWNCLECSNDYWALYFYSCKWKLPFIPTSWGNILQGSAFFSPLNRAGWNNLIPWRQSYRQKYDL